MREYDGGRRGVDQLARGPVARMRAARHHSHAVHYGHRIAPESRQPAVFLHATAARDIGEIIGDEHPAHAKIIIKLDHAELPAERVHPLDVETDRQLARRLGGRNVPRGGCQQIAPGPFSQPCPDGPQHPDVLLDALIPEADVERDRVDARVMDPFELGKEAVVVGTQRHAGVIVPYHGVSDPFADCISTRAHLGSHHLAGPAGPPSIGNLAIGDFIQLQLSGRLCI